MSEEPVIGGESAASGEPEHPGEPLIGGPSDGAPQDDARAGELAALLRDTLLATHDDLAPEDLAGGRPDEVRKAYAAARARIEREAGEARTAQVPAGAPGRFAPAPGSAFEKIREGLTRLHA